MVFGNMSLSGAIDVIKAEKELAEAKLKLSPGDVRAKNFIDAVDTINSFIDKSVGVFMLAGK